MNSIAGTIAAALAALGAVELAACTTSTAPVNPAVSSIMRDDPAALGFDAGKLAEIRTQLNDDIAKGRIPGAYMLVGRRGHIAFAEGFGVQGPGQSAPVSEETIFRIYSMTKPVVTVTAMTLVEHGKLDLDAPVSKYLSGFESPVVFQPDGTTRPATKPMLIRHLMSHTSGLIYGFFQPDTALGKVYSAGGEDRVDLPAKAWAEQIIGKLPLAAEPGTTWIYSRSVDVLGAVIESVTGQSLDIAVKERVTGPLGMTDTDFSQPKDKAARFAEPKAADPMFTDYTLATPFKEGGGGMSSTAEDYLRFVLMLSGKGTFQGARILRPETVALMQVDQLTPAIRENGGRFGKDGTSFGLGFQIVLDETKQRAGAGAYSWYGIGGTDFWIDPKNDLFAIFMIQDGTLGGEYRRKNRERVYDALVR